MQHFRSLLAAFVVILLTISSLIILPVSAGQRIKKVGTQKTAASFGQVDFGQAQQSEEAQRTTNQFGYPNFSVMETSAEKWEKTEFENVIVEPLSMGEAARLMVDPNQSGGPIIGQPVEVSRTGNSITYQFPFNPNDPNGALYVPQVLNKNNGETIQPPNGIRVATMSLITQTIGNLAPSVPYAFRVAGQNGFGQTFTNPIDFVLGGGIVTPAVITGNADLVTTNSFRINGTITPNGSVRGGARVREQGSTTWIYSPPSDNPNGGIGSGNSPLPMSVTFQGAKPATWYEFEVLAVAVDATLGQPIQESKILGVGGVKTVKTEGNTATLTVTANRNLIQVGETVTMSATSAGQDVSRLTRFVSSDPSVLSPSGDLLFTGVHEGVATVTGTYNGLSSSFVVTVRGVPPPDWNITIAPQFSGNEVTPITLSVTVTGSSAITSYRWQGFGQEVETSVPTLTLTLPAAMNPYSLTVVATHVGGQSKTVTSSIKVVDVVSITKARFDGTSLLVKATTSSTARLTTMGVSWPGGSGILVKRGKKGLFVGNFETTSSPSVITVTSPFGGTATLQKG